MAQKYEVVGTVSVLWIGIMCSMVATTKPINEERRTAHIAIFVHGSVYTYLSMENPVQAWRDELDDDCTYLRVLRCVRKNKLLRQRQVMLDEGLVFIGEALNNDNLTLHDYVEKDGAYPIVYAYDQCALLISKTNNVDRLYYSFGHLGVLSSKYRKDVARVFYDGLVVLIHDCMARYKDVKITIVSHSHGGNISLYLGYWEQEMKQGLFIDELIMFGTPIQKETAAFSASGCFGRVFNCYSEGDWIQSANLFPAEDRKNHQSFFVHDLHKIDYKHGITSDVRLLVKHKPSIIDHANMWLMGRSKIAPLFDPFPLIILAPIIADNIARAPFHERYDCNLAYSKNDLHLEMSPFKQRKIDSWSCSLGVVIKEIRENVSSWWKPFDTSSDPVFNSTEGTVLREALREAGVTMSLGHRVIDALLQRLFGV